MSVGRNVRRTLAVVTAALLAVTLTPAVAPAAPASPAHHGHGHGQAFNTGSAAAALRRVIGGARAAQVRLVAVDRGTGPDRYRVAARHGHLQVSGTTPAVLLAGFGTYLRKVAHADVSLDGSQLDLPRRLPLPRQPIARNANADHRFALNDTNEGYAGAYLNWRQWQHRIDVMALLGINEVLVYEGQDAVYEKTFQKFGYSAADMRDWIPQPAHQSWWLLENICCTGSPISQQLIDRRAQLGAQITGRLRSLGMTPVLPGYYGTVPGGFADRNPGAHTVPQGTWDGLDQPDWLDPTDPHYAKVAAEFYRVQTRMFGKSTMYKMDLLHEGGKPGDVDVADASRAVQAALDEAHPGAIWAILGWQHNPLPATLEAVDSSKMLVVDGISEKPSVTDRDADFQGTPYAFGTIWNFGGHTNLGASVAEWNRKYHQWRDKPDTALNGIALMPEAIDNNPAAVAFFADMAWQDGPVDLHDWFSGYATSRYGGSDPHAAAAWRILSDTVYSWPADVDTKHPMSLYANEPSLATTSAPLPYDTSKFDSALGELLKVAPRLRHSTAYRYDLVDVARQVLANHSRTLLPRIDKAYHDHDLATFSRLTRRWMDRMGLLDDLLGTDGKFLFGSWQHAAVGQARGHAEADALRYDVRSIVTLWASDTTLQDYARREWNGLVGDYYAGRWRRYFHTLTTALKTGSEPATIDWGKVAQTWAHADTRYPSRPHGSAYAEASKVAQLPAGGLTVSADPRGIAPGGTASVTATFTNRNHIAATGTVTGTLHAPSGYTVTADGPTHSGAVAPGETFTARWKLTAPDDATAADVPTLSATAHWDSGHAQATAHATGSLLVTGDVSAPYRAADNTDASFAQHGDTLGIAGGGTDAWKSHMQYGTIYRPDALTDGHAATTTVTRNQAVSDYARAGLVAAPDLGTPADGGAANIAVTPGHGCMFSYDSDGDGTFDHYSEVDGFGADVSVRLSRDGDRFTGACSTDGKNWSVVGAATVPDGSAATDVGVFFSAVNKHDGTQGLATFEGLRLADYTPRDDSGDTLRSRDQPVTASGAEDGHPASAANDGSRANSPYWGGPLTGDGAWWQVDLGSTTHVSKINVRNYVDGSRYYTYRLLGSTDGKHWFVLGGRMGTDPVTDAGDTFHTQASARYVRVLGLSNSANPTFHLSEVSVYGTPAAS